VTVRPAWLELVERLPVTAGRRALVLGDAEAHVCHELAGAGWDVSCCPDSQRGRGPSEHVDARFERVADLVASSEELDVVVATDGWRRLRDTNRAEAVGELLEWVRRNARVAVVEAPRQYVAPDLHDLGPFATLDLLGRFRFLAEVPDDDAALAPRTPLVTASDRYLLADGAWIEAGDAERLDADPQGGPWRPVRTFRVPHGRIVKVECTSEDYFERTQLLGEASFLGDVDERVRAELGLPRLVSLVRGRAVTTLIREDLAAGPAPTVDDQLAAVVDLAARYAAHGLFHNDVRPWNLLWDGGRARLIDFTETSGHDDDVRDLPQVLALAGTLAAIATDEIGWGDPFHTDVLDLADRTGLLERWPLERQLRDPWLALPDRRDRIVARGGMSAEEILRGVLEATGE
jgi:hypothetical protein